MPSDFEPIAKTECVGCGRPSITVSESGVALKRLNTYSRAFGCLTCYLKYSNCANCGHEKHKSLHSVIVAGDYENKWGICHCGCGDYRHGLEAEFDRQFSEHTGKKPTQRKCNHCGNWFNGTTLFCDRCEREWRELNNG